MECYYHYKCTKCNYYFSFICPPKEEYQHNICPNCNEITYRIIESRIIGDGSTKCGYISAEKQSSINKKREGRHKLEEMLQKDPVAKIRKERGKKLPWYRDGSVPGLPKDDKPLNLNEIKDVSKYIDSGEK